MGISLIINLAGQQKKKKKKHPWNWKTTNVIEKYNTETTINIYGM